MWRLPLFSRTRLLTHDMRHATRDTQLPAPPPREQVPDLSSEGSSASDSSIADIDVPASLAASDGRAAREAREAVGVVGGGVGLPAYSSV